jgi:hypothetical protein
MSATVCRLEYVAAVADPDHWAAEHRAHADAQPGGSYDDWVVEQLGAAMRAAGDEFIRNHPDLFASDSLI